LSAGGPRAGRGGGLRAGRLSRSRRSSSRSRRLARNWRRRWSRSSRTGPSALGCRSRRRRRRGRRRRGCRGRCRRSRRDELGWAGDLLIAEVGVVGGLVPVDVPGAAGGELGELRGGEDGGAAAEHALLLGRMIAGVLLLALCHKTTIGGAELGGLNTPLIGAGVKEADAAARGQDVKLAAADVVADVGGLDDHGLALEGVGAGILGVVVAGAGELELVAAAADVALGRHSGEAVGEGVADRPRVIAITGEGAALIERLAGGGGGVGGAEAVVGLVAAGEWIGLRVHVGGPAAVGLATVPITGGVAVAGAVVERRELAARGGAGGCGAGGCGAGGCGAGGCGAGGSCCGAGGCGLGAVALAGRCGRGRRAGGRGAAFGLVAASGARAGGDEGEEQGDGSAAEGLHGDAS
jgi:hypothetical protein